MQDIYTDGVLVEEWDDESRTYTDHRTGQSRPYTDEENSVADADAEQDARLDDHEARLRRIEEVVFPAPPDPEDLDDPSVPNWEDIGGVWPSEGLLRDGGKVYRNKSGVPLTTPPSGFPGDPGQWTHLFIEVGATTDPDPDPDPDPERPEGYVGPWDADATYAVGDVVDRDGRYYRCRVAHGPEYEGTWGPPQASVWDDIGPV